MNELTEALQAIRARINEELDHPSLKDYCLSESSEEDVLDIIRCNIG